MLIKQWKICGNVLWRGDVNEQGLNWILATQLTALAMRLRNSYPRGQKFIDQAGEMEEWEREMREYLYVDPLAPDLY